MPEEVLRAWALDAKVALERAAEAVPTKAKYGECATCHQPYERFDSPSGVFYSHFTHPQDGHDAVPLPTHKIQDGEAGAALVSIQEEVTLLHTPTDESVQEDSGVYASKCSCGETYFKGESDDQLGWRTGFRPTYSETREVKRKTAHARHLRAVLADAILDRYSLVPIPREEVVEEQL